MQNKIVVCMQHTERNNLIRKVVFIFSEMKMEKFSMFYKKPFLLILLTCLTFQGGKDIDQEIGGVVAFLPLTLMLID